MSENLDKYKETIEKIYRETKDDLWTMPHATLVLLLFGVLFMTIIVNVVFFSFGSWLLALPVYALEIAAPLYVLYRHRQKIDAAAREKVSALEATKPGIVEAYAEWLSKAGRSAAS